jgi:GTP pyrophosphokinase/guanosine-3',5'-bis(diphosphate) 3'-pyrophosphohydrolase
MPLDFAYEIHSAVGDACIGSKINDRLIALRTPLSNGDTIEIIRGSKPVVPPDWKILAITKRARARIRRHIRRTSPPDEAADPKA